MGLKNSKPPSLTGRKRSALELLETHFDEALKLAFQAHFEEPCYVEQSTIAGEFEVTRANGNPLTKVMQGWCIGFTQNHLRVCAFLRKYK